MGQLILKTQIKMLAKALLITLLSVYGVQSMKDVDDETMTMIQNFGLCSACWGQEFADAYKMSIHEASKKCMGTADVAVPLNAVVGYPASLLRSVVHTQMPTYTYGTYGYNPYVNLGRKKRDASHYTVTDAHAANFMADMETMIGNFSCVMKELGLLTATGAINTDVFSHSGQGHFASGSKAGADPVFVNELTSHMGTCYKMSQTMPEEIFMKNAFMQKYGRMAVYFKCIKEVERQCCAKYVLADTLERFGVPLYMVGSNNKYDAAAMTVKMMKHSATPEMKHLDDYFWGDMDM